MPTATGMTGPRSWSFACGGQTLGCDGTDFQVVPSADSGSDAPVFKLTLKKCWEHSDFTQFNMDRVKFTEARWAELACNDLLNCVGTLVIDGVAVTSPMKFKGVSFDDSGSPNNLLIFNVEFERSFAGASMYRSLEFGDKILFGASQNFIVKFGNDPRFSFILPFRAAPVYVDDGPGLETITVTGLIQTVVGGSPLQRQQNIEQATGALIVTHKGKVDTLKIDNRDCGTCRLADVVIGQSFGNQVLIELVFTSGFGVIE